MKNANWVTVILANLLSHISFSQANFIATDSTLVSVPSLVETNEILKSQYIEVDDQGKITRYTPDDITEYGFMDGRLFRSFNIELNGQTSRYFFERLYKGAFSVYYLPHSRHSYSFYITENDSLPLVKIPEEKANYLTLLRNYVKDCPQAGKNLETVKLTKSGLTKFLQNYETCSFSPASKIRYGVIAGMSLTRFGSNDNYDILSAPSYQINPGYYLGTYASIPIGKSDKSLVIGPVIHRYGSSTPFDFRGVKHDLVINQWRLNIPVMANFRLPGFVPGSFFELGPVYSGRLAGENLLFSYSENNTSISIEIEEPVAITKHQVGFSVGAGLDFERTPGSVIHIKLGYEKNYPLKRLVNTLNVGEVMFIVGVLF